MSSLSRSPSRPSAPETESGARRSGRASMRPLAFWANERVIYQSSSAEGLRVAGVLTHDPLGVDGLRSRYAEAPEDPDAPKRPREGSGGGAKKKASGGGGGGGSRKKKKTNAEVEGEAEAAAAEGEAAAAAEAEDQQQPAAAAVAAPSTPLPGAAAEPAPERVVDCRRWGRGFQYMLAYTGGAESVWLDAKEVPSALIDAYTRSVA